MRGISWAALGSHRIEKMRVYDRKTEFIKVSKNIFFYFGPRGTRDPIKPIFSLFLGGPDRFVFFPLKGVLGGGFRATPPK